MRLISDESIKISPGKNEEEKITSLSKMLEYLSSILDMELTHIDPNALIVSKEKESAKYLLGLFIDLIELVHNNTETTTTLPSELIEGEQCKSVQNDSTFIHKGLEDINNEGIDKIINSNKKDDANVKVKGNSCKIKIINLQKKNKHKQLKSKNEYKDNLIENNNKDKVKANKEDNKCLFSFRDKKTKGTIQIKEKDSKKKLKIFYTDKDLKNYITTIIKSIYKNQQYTSLLQRNDYKVRFNSIIAKIKGLFFSEYQNEKVTQEYIDTNKNIIIKIIKSALKIRVDPQSNISMRIALQIMKDKAMLKEMHQQEVDKEGKYINVKKEIYNKKKIDSDGDINRVKNIYVKALRLEGKRCVEEIKNQNELCELKEMQMTLKNKDTNEFIMSKKEYLEEMLKYEKFKHEREKKIRNLKLNEYI